MINASNKYISLLDTATDAGNINLRIQMMKDYLSLYEDFRYGGQLIFNDENSKNRLYAKSPQQAADIIGKSFKNRTADSVFCTLNDYRHPPNMTIDELKHLRCEQYLWGIEQLMIDIDAPAELAGFEMELFEPLTPYFESYGIPEPNYISLSGGGGIHFQYFFNRLPAKQMAKRVRRLKNHAAETFQSILDEANIQTCIFDNDGKPLTYHVDFSVLDNQRQVRIPGSINPKTGRVHVGIKTDIERYDFKELESRFFEDDNISSEIMVSGNSEPANKNYPYFNYDSVTNAEKEKFKNVNQCRISRIFNLAKKGKDFTHCREIACHIIACSFKLLDCPQEEILNQLKKFNSLLKHPLKEQELIHASDPSKNYTYSNKQLCELLHLTDSEQKEFFRKCKFGKKRTLTGRQQKTLDQNILVARAVIVEHLSSKKIEKKYGVNASTVRNIYIRLRKKGFIYYAFFGRKNEYKKVVKSIIEKIHKSAVENAEFFGISGFIFHTENSNKQTCPLFYYIISIGVKTQGAQTPVRLKKKRCLYIISVPDFKSTASSTWFCCYVCKLC